MSRYDEPARAACTDNWYPYEALIEETKGPTYQEALGIAQRTCYGCPIRQRCWTDNADEVWLNAVKGVYPLPTTERPTCGTTAGATAHYKARETPCEPCRTAQNARPRKRKVAVCGTPSGYHRHRRTLKEDACAACLEAHAKEFRDRAEQRRGNNEEAA